MKRLISIFLSFTMLTGIITLNSNINGNKIYGATNDLNTSFNKALVTGGESNFPLETSGTTTISPNTLFFDFQIENLNDEYVLKYYDSKNNEINFVAKKISSDKIEIEYINKGDANNFSAYEIYSGSSASYISAKDFIAINVANTDNFVDNYETSGISHPKFTISPGGGFSVKSNGAIYHFLLSPDGKTMKYSCDSFDTGFVYDGILSKNGTVVDTKRMLTGIDNFDFKPYANDSIYSNGVVNQSTGSDKDPGSDDVGLDISFNIPKVLNGTSYSNSYENDKMPITLNLNSTGTGSFTHKNLQILIPDISVTGTTSLDLDSNGSKETTLEITNTQVKVKISTLTAGVLYDNVTLNLIPDNTLASDVKIIGRQTNVEDDVFTFPKYSIVNSGDRYVVVLEPFHGFKGNYVLYENNQFSVSTKYNGEGNLTFPTSLTTESSQTNNFRIFFSPEQDFEDYYSLTINNAIHSQELSYASSKGNNYLLKPENFNVVEYDTYAKEGEENSKTLVATFNWDIGYKEAIEQRLAESSTGEIEYVYELRGTTTPENTSSFSGIDKVKIIVKKDTNDVDKDGDTSELVAKYSLINSAYGDTIVNTSESILEVAYRSSSDTNVYIANPTINFNIGHITNNTGYAFYYPNIYFLVVKPISFNGSPVNISSSSMDSITLNDNESNILPPPQNATIDTNSVTTTFDANGKATEVSFNLQWTLDGLGMYNYFNKMYTKETLDKLTNLSLSSNPKDHSSNKTVVNSVADFDMFFNIYISEDGQYMQNQFGNYPYVLEVDETGQTRISASNGFDYDVTKNSGNILFSDINGKSGYTINSAPAINELRNNSVVAVEKIPIYYNEVQGFITSQKDILRSIKLDGLDLNQTYYIYIDTVGIHKFPTVGNTGSNKTITNYSMLTPITHVTTGDKQDKPSVTDKTPSAPNLVLEETTSDSSSISWDNINIFDDDTGKKLKVEYEIIRLEGYQIKDEFLNTFLPFKDSYNFVNHSGKEGFRTNGSYDQIYEWNGSSFNTSPSSSSKIHISNNKLYFDDTGLDANKIYYYYVRTVLVGDDGQTYSTWSRISGTTANIQGPINLKIIQDPSLVNLGSIDRETQAVLNFDLPISSTQNIGKDLFVQLSIKKDNGEFSTPITINSSNLKWSSTTANQYGYINCSYIVSNLEPGTSYSFKVRLIDNLGQVSIYSNIATTKTDINQEDYDDNEDIKNWQQHLLDLLKKEINDPYWVMADNNNNYEILYRDEKFEGYSNSQGNNYFTLLPSKENKTNNYYIPANALSLLNDKNKGIKVIYENTEFFLSSDAISKANSAYKKMAKDIEVDNIKDYYLKITVSGNNINSANNIEAISDSISFNTSFVGFETSIYRFEQLIYKNILAMVENNSVLKEYYEKLDNGVKDDLNNEKLQEIVLDAVDDMKDEITSSVGDDFHDYIASSKYTYSIENYDSNLLITLLENVTGNVQGYKYQNSKWNELTTTNKVMVSLQSGTFVFTLVKISLPNVNVSDDIMDLIVKYDLDDYLGSGDNFNPNIPVTNQTVLGITGRLLGAKVGEDPVTHLKSKGLYATNRNSNSNMNQEYVYYYLMAIYENKSNIDLDSYVISNYTLTQNMKNLDTRTKKSMYVATDLGLNTNKSLDGDSSITVSEYLKLLEKLNSKLKL